MTKSKALSKKTSSISCGPWASSSWALACSSGQASAAPPSQQHAEKSIEIYSVRSVVRKPLVGSGKCEFIAPHSVEAWISNDENVANQHHNRRGSHYRSNNKKDVSFDDDNEQVQVTYFMPSRCACFHCLLSERLELPVPHPGRQCLDG